MKLQLCARLPPCLPPSPPITLHILPLPRTSLVCAHLQVSAPWHTPLWKTQCTCKHPLLIEPGSFLISPTCSKSNAETLRFAAEEGFIHETAKQENNSRASLVAQWLRICLLMQGTRVRALVWEDPTCHGAAGPVSHNC